MLKLIKIQNADNDYWYLPESDIYPGKLRLNPNDGSVTILKQAPRDIELGASYYGNKARGELHNMWKNGDLQDEKLIVWF